MTVLVDSDVLIEVSRGRNSAILTEWQKLSGSNDIILYSPVTMAELWAGARPREHQLLTNFFAALVCAPVDAEIGRQAGDYLRQYHKSHSLELGDALIAATALSHRARLWTRNLKHYPMSGLSFY
jgi:predicted nucleic acid-binding protein